MYMWCVGAVSQAQLGVRAKPNQLQPFCAGLSVNQYQIRPNVAIPMIAPFAGQRVIPVTCRQQFIFR